MKLVKKNVVAQSDNKRRFALSGTSEKSKSAVKKEKTSKELAKYKDEYVPLTETEKFCTRQFESFHGDPVRDHLEVSVKRLGGNDEENPVCVFLQMWKESERYTGPSKGRTVYFPVEHLDEVIDALTKQKERCEEAGLRNEWIADENSDKDEETA